MAAFLLSAVGRKRNPLTGISKIYRRVMVAWNKENEGVESMIEIICNESEKDGSSVVIRPPKNIRQIGSPKGRHKIYMEDYVYTFLHSAVFGRENRRRAAVLLGKSQVSGDIRYTFISGAISCEEFIFQSIEKNVLPDEKNGQGYAPCKETEDEIAFNEKCWEYIYKEIKQYFDSQEILGWFLEQTGFPPELNSAMEAAHRKYFAGRDKILFLSEPAEDEDVFFAHEQGKLQRKEGYYIYYEKNVAMQEYMVCFREKMRNLGNGIDAHILNDGEELLTDCQQVESVAEAAEKTAAEQAIQNYRTMFQQKKEVSAGRRMSMFLYTTAAAAMVILCVIGVTTMNNFEKMQKVEETLAVISSLRQKDETEKDKEEKTEVSVESVPGKVSAEQSEVQQPVEGTGTEPQKPSGQPGETQQGENQQPTAGNAPQEAATSAQTYLEQGYYIVQAGDKLELICKNIYQTLDMMDKLCEANGIEDVDKIQEGQKLILP